MINDPQLYIVPTPIGNMEDITLRAIETLKNSDIILAEDTRHAKKLLNHYNISTKANSYHINNEHNKVNKYIQMIISGNKVSLITDAGTPCISDPGFLLIREAIKYKILITCLPAHSIYSCISYEWITCDSFVFEGFLPRKKGRKSKLSEISQNTKTTILYESPFRIIKTLNDLKDVIGLDRKIAVVREISKIYEEVFRGTLEEAIQEFTNRVIKGEFVICIDKVE